MITVLSFCINSHSVIRLFMEKPFFYLLAILMFNLKCQDNITGDAILHVQHSFHLSFSLSLCMCARVYVCS